MIDHQEHSDDRVIRLASIQRDDWCDLCRAKIPAGHLAEHTYSRSNPLAPPLVACLACAGQPADGR